MILVACSSRDIASSNAASALISRAGLSERGAGRYGNGKIELRITDSILPMAQGLDDLGAELIIFMSRHSSVSGIAAFTVHPTGNWGKEARMGGAPQTLSTAAPYAMAGILRLFASSPINIEATYEATHHGPALKTPSLFAEFGGNEATISDKKIADELSRIVYEHVQGAADSKSESKLVALGIGGTHYPRKFTSLALSKGYAFSHMMPKHAILNADGTDNVDMISQAVEKSSEKVEKAIIDWKSMSSEFRSRIIKKLGDIGVDYERV